MRPSDLGGSTSPTPDHLIPAIGATDWAIWRSACLRSGGFPLDWVLRLASPRLADAADDLDRVLDERKQAVAAAVRLLDAELDVIKTDGRWEGPEGRKALDVRRKLTTGKRPRTQPGDRYHDMVAALWEHDALVAEHLAAYRGTFADATAQSSAVLTELAADEQLCEAIVWQNRNAYRTAVKGLRTPAKGRNSRRRQHEELLARYLQRYCVKNDTIGFFGPTGWVDVNAEGPALAVEHGSGQGGTSLLRSRTVHFEQWAVDALADTINSQPGATRCAAPRRLPFAHLEEDTVYLSDGTTLALRPAQAAVLRACDGRRTAHEIAEAVMADHLPQDGGFAALEEVYAYLTELHGRQLIVWRLEAPYTTDADAALRSIVESVGDPKVRALGTKALTLIQAAGTAVADAAGDPNRLDTALHKLDFLFERLTGQSATTGEGRMYAGRSLVYEDCVRDVDIALGSDLRTRIETPLSLLIHSARWLTSAVAEHTRDHLSTLHARLAGEHMTDAVPVTALWQKLPEVFAFLGEERRQTDTAAVAAGRAELQRRWSEALGHPDLTQSRLHYRSEDLRAPIGRLFPAEAPGWTQARYLSPDVMIAARDAEAVRSGDFLAVLGEMHLANNTLAAALFVDSFPDRAAMLRCAEFDLPHPSVIPVVPRSWPGMTSRTRHALSRTGDYYLLMSSEFEADATIPPDRLLSIGELVVEPTPEGLVVRTYDRRAAFDAVEFLGTLLSISVIDAFRMFPKDPHTPRITIDDLVVQREAWRFELSDLPFHDTPEQDRFHTVRAWARGHGIPRWAFLALAQEAKPMFVDFDSPILVEIFARTLRNARSRTADSSSITLSEMLPDFGACWLDDPHGRHYTSELRFVAVDLAGRP